MFGISAQKLKLKETESSETTKTTVARTTALQSIIVRKGKWNSVSILTYKKSKTFKKLGSLTEIKSLKGKFVGNFHFHSRTKSKL